MKYIFNRDFKLEQKDVPFHGTVDFVSRHHQDDIVVLNGSLKTIVVQAQKQGFIHSGEYPKAELDRLHSEGILVASDQRLRHHRPYFSDSINFWLQVTDQCNLACNYCYIPSLNSKYSLRPDIFNRLGEKLLCVSGLKVVNLKIAGGEPLLAFHKWKDGLVDLRELLLKHGIELSVRLVSNLTVLTEEMITYFRDFDMSISISLDGIGEFNDKNRIYVASERGTYSTVRSNLNTLFERGIKPSVMITATSENQSGVHDLVKFLIENDITFRIADAKGGGISKDEFDSLMGGVMNILEKGAESEYPVSRRVVISDLRTHYPSSTPCSMGKNGAAIYLDGSIFFCHTEFDKGSPLGSIDEDENILSIINRGKEKHFDLSDDCRKCEYRLVCAGGCPLYRVNGKSPMCGAYKKTIKRVFEIYDQEDSEV